MQKTPYTVWRAPSGAAVVSTPGQIDRSNCARMYMALVWAVESGAPVVVADLTRADFCGHAATVTLVSVNARASRAGAQLRVAAAPPNARLIGHIAGTGHRLDFYPDLAAALAGPRSRATNGGTIVTDYRLRRTPNPAARNSAGKPVGRLSAVPLVSQAPPLGPSRDPA